MREAVARKSVAVASKGRGRLSRLRRREEMGAYLFILPWLLGFLVFTAGPMVYSAWLSLNEYPILRPPEFIGLDNFKRMFDGRDELLLHSLKLTTIWVVTSVPLGVIVGYLLALLLNQKVRGLSIFRTGFYIPSVVPALATAYLWAWILSPNLGVLPAVIRALGFTAPCFLTCKEWVMTTLVLMSVWGSGSSMVLYLAALQGVPTALYDAAKVDGAGSLRRFWHITIPMTSPVIFFTFVMSMIGSFQTFSTPFVLTQGGPANATLFYMLHLFRQGWSYFKMGYASAMAWVLFAIIMALTLLSLRVSGRVVYYEGATRR